MMPSVTETRKTMKRQKQESILASFSRLQKPLVKRAKWLNGEVSMSTMHGRDLSVVGSLETEIWSGNDDDAAQDADGSVTDVDVLSSQEDGVEMARPLRLRTDRVTKPPVVPFDPVTLATPEPLQRPENDILLHTTKDVKDSVHGIITFEPICWRIIDTFQFQRLRNLHQLGAAANVYIGATHTRFEHCLGVAHLAERMVRSIREHQPYLPISSRDVMCIKIAGLCHDLGHGPFSHVFDGIYMKQLRQRKLVDAGFEWTHEQGSLEMFDLLLHDNRIDITEYGLKDIDVTFIKELIYGGALPGSTELRGRPRKDQQFLYDFVNNAKSGLDVDKLDYFMRDARQTGAKASCDVEILIRNARVLADRDDPEQKPSICFPEKLAGQVMQAFRTRFELHQTVYQHKSIRAAEYMLCDAFLAADEHLIIKGRRISEIVRHINAYQYLDDRILARIEESDSKELSESRAIRRRMISRSYYDFVGSTSVTSHSHKLAEEKILEEVLSTSPARVILNTVRDDIIVEFVRVHYGKGDQDPLQFVRFYAKNSSSSSTCYKLSPESYHSHMPAAFQDSCIRVYVKQKRLVAPVREAFALWCSRYNGSSVRPRSILDD